MVVPKASAWYAWTYHFNKLIHGLGLRDRIFPAPAFLRVVCPAQHRFLIQSQLTFRQNTNNTETSRSTKLCSKSASFSTSKCRSNYEATQHCNSTLPTCMVVAVPNHLLIAGAAELGPRVCLRKEGSAKRNCIHGVSPGLFTMGAHSDLSHLLPRLWRCSWGSGDIKPMFLLLHHNSSIQYLTVLELLQS